MKTLRLAVCLHILQEFHKLNSLSRSYNNVPAGKLRFQIALEYGNLSGDHQSTVLDLVLNIKFLNVLRDGTGGELAGRPGGQKKVRPRH